MTDSTPDPKTLANREAQRRWKSSQSLLGREPVSWWLTPKERKALERHLSDMRMINQRKP